MTPQWAWASHQPLVKANMKYFKPDFVLEIGTGLYSTPHLATENTQYLGIEQDLKWISKVEAACPSAKIEHHNLQGISIEKRHWQLSTEQKYVIVEYYYKLKERIKDIKGIKLLFVDCFTCSRMYAINMLWPHFDIILFHDCQPHSRRIYGYDKLQVENYDLRYLQCRTAWTGMYSRLAGVDSQYSDLIQANILDFEKEWKVKTGMRVQ